jgi:hypothetical protein
MILYALLALAVVIELLTTPWSVVRPSPGP